MDNAHSIRLAWIININIEQFHNKAIRIRISAGRITTSATSKTFKNQAKR